MDCLYDWPFISLIASSTVISPRSICSRISAVVRDGVGGVAGGLGGVSEEVLAGAGVEVTFVAGTPSTSKFRLPETLFNLTAVPPFPTWVVLSP
jgi:hypothetical protein